MRRHTSHRWRLFLLQGLEFSLGLFQLCDEGGFVVQGGDYGACNHAGGIYAALPVITADDPALPHFKSALEDLLLAGRVDFGEYQRACPADSRVAGGIGAVFRESCLVIRAAGVFAEESEGTDAHIVLFGGTGGELARIFAEIAQQFVDPGCLFR